MLRIRGGDTGAFAELVGRYQPAVLNAAARFLGNRAIAEEIAQDVFVRIFKARDSWEPRAKFDTWLHRIVFNLCANAAEYGRRRRTLSLDALAGDDDRRREIDSGALDPLRAMEREETGRRVRAAILALPAQQRAALILTRYHGLAHGDVAESLGTSVEAVKSLLFRAREKLRETLAPDLQPEGHGRVRGGISDEL